MTYKKPDSVDASGLLRRRDVLVASVVGALAYSLPNSLATAAENTGPVRIGSLAPFSGPSSRTGENIRQATNLAIADARAAGELPFKINGVSRDIEIIEVDDQSDPEKAVRALRDAVSRKGVEFMINGWHSSVAMATMDVGADLGIVHLGNLGESQFIAEKINSDVSRYSGYFKCTPAPAALSVLYGAPLNYFREKGIWKPKNLKAAILVEDTDHGRGWGSSIIASLTAAGYEVGGLDVVPFDETEFSAIITKYKALDISLLMTSITAPVGASNFVKQFRTQNLKALLVSHGLTWFSEWHEMTGEASDFNVSMDSPASLAPWQSEWMERFKGIYGEEPSIMASGLPYDYTRMAIKAINLAGSLEKDKLIEAIRSMSYRGIWNTYGFATEAGKGATAPNEVITGPFMEGFFFPMIQIMGGERKILWPLEYSEAEFRSPPWLE
jgi:branched-chain amino acid transport system substrate-binding protein